MAEPTGEEKLSPELEAKLTKLADAWYSGWNHAGRRGMMEMLRVAYHYGLSHDVGEQSQPPIEESLDFNRLRSGDRRALYADHQTVFDAYYANEKDAERYRFLRDHAYPGDVEMWWWGYLGQADPVPTVTFDRLIDEEIAKHTNSEG